MKHLLLTTIAAVLLVGCGESQPPEPWTPSDTPIELAAGILGNIETVKKYLDDGKDVNAKNEYGWTHLNHAAEGGHKELIELLIENGADLNVKDETLGKTPLGWAIHRKKTEAADLIRKHGGKTGEELKAEGK